jgi:hypothetical protein
MKLDSKFAVAKSWDAAWATGILLTLALCVGGLVRVPPASRVAHIRNMKTNLYAPRASAVSALEKRSEVRSYFMDFAGDHSLDFATVIEQPSSGYTRYIVHLRLASGAEQSVVVTAPPGGLQVEMQDMTGDKIPNDVVLRPALLRWLPTVLVNDGHEHFDVAVPGPDPHSFSSDGGLGSRRHDQQTFVLLLSSGFKSVHLSNSRRLFDPQLQQSLLSSVSYSRTNRLGHTLSPGRAPPLVATI